MNTIVTWCRFAVLLAGLALPALGFASYTRYEETHPSVSYEGNWQSVSGSSVSGGSVKAADAAGAKVTLAFTGTGIKWLGYRCTCTTGIARVYIDGQLYTTLNTWAERPEAQREIVTIRNLPNQRHVLTIEVTGERRSTGDNAYIAIDAFDVENGRAATLLQETASEITYSGAWMDIDDPSLSGGSVVAAREAGAKATLRFNGTGFTWIGYTCPCAAGIAYITIDGQQFTSAQYGLSGREAQTVKYDNPGLAPGNHEVTIEVSGASTEGSPETAWVVIDAFRIYGDSVGSADTTAPSVAITSHANDAEVSGVVTLTASASDNVGVTKVQFLLGDLILGEDTTAPYTMTRDMSGATSDNMYGVKARAYDAAGNYDDSPVVRIMVRHLQERNPPTAEIVSPTEGSTVSGVINLEVAATDDSGVYEIMRNIDPQGGSSIGHVFNSAAATFDTRFLVDGTHLFAAQARDIYSNYSAVDFVTFTVDNSVQPGMRRLDNEHPSVVYTGTWSAFGGTNADGTQMFHWNDAVGASQLGATATITFQGTGVRWLGARCYLCGDAYVSIDGGPLTTVGTRGGDDLYEPGNRNAVLYSSPTLANGTHTLTISVAQSHPAYNLVLVDAFEILGN